LTMSRYSNDLSRAYDIVRYCTLIDKWLMCQVTFWNLGPFDEYCHSTKFAAESSTVAEFKPSE